MIFLHKNHSFTNNNDKKNKSKNPLETVKVANSELSSGYSSLKKQEGEPHQRLHDYVTVSSGYMDKKAEMRGSCTEPQSSLILYAHMTVRRGRAIF